MRRRPLHNRRSRGILRRRRCYGTWLKSGAAKEQRDRRRIGLGGGIGQRWLAKAFEPESMPLLRVLNLALTRIQA